MLLFTSTGNPARFTVISHRRASLVSSSGSSPVTSMFRRFSTVEAGCMSGVLVDGKSPKSTMLGLGMPEEDATDSLRTLTCLGIGRIPGSSRR